VAKGRAGANVPELLNHAQAEVQSKKPTADALREMTPTMAWAACVSWLRQYHQRGHSAGRNLPPEWPNAEHIRAMCPGA